MRSWRIGDRCEVRTRSRRWEPATLSTPPRIDVAYAMRHRDGYIYAVRVADLRRPRRRR